MVEKYERRESSSEDRKIFEHTVFQIKRVTKVTKGGQQLHFTVLTLVGDPREKSIMFASEKSNDVATAMRKSVAQAKKKLTNYFPNNPRTIPRQIEVKYKATKIKFRPTRVGRGIKASKEIGDIFKYLGIQDVSAKIIGSSNKANVVRCVFKALRLITNKRSDY